MQTIVGDIGGTKTVLALAETTEEGVDLKQVRRYPSGAFASLETMIEQFLAEFGTSSDLAAFAVAGPVHGDHSRITNLPWEIDGRHLERKLGFDSARLLNDLEAVAWGISVLGAADFEVLHAGDAAAQGNACVVAAGTGLGEAGMYWDGVKHRPFATEGGHGDFAPADEREYKLLRFLQERYGHVSWERVVSGMGIEHIYDFLKDQGDHQAASGLDPSSHGEDRTAAIAGAAAEDACPLCSETMAMFARLYGREAGNMALKHLALGGVYLAGGIAPKNLGLLRRPGFLSAFFDKGRMDLLMRRMPVRVILEPHVALFGAARFMVDRLF